MSPPSAYRLQTAAWLGLGCAGLALLYLLSGMLEPFVLGAVAAYICTPLVTYLERYRIPRTVGTLLALLTVALTFTILLLIIVPLLYREITTLINELPDLANHLNAHLAPFLRRYFDIRIQFNADMVRNWLFPGKGGSQDLVPQLLDHVKIGGSVLFAVALNIVLVPIAMFHLLRDWPRVTHFLDEGIPRPWYALACRLTHDIDCVLSEFLRGQLAVMVLLAGYYSLALWMADVPFAPALGVLTGLLIFIPYVGYGFGLGLALLVAVLQGDGQTLFAVLLVYGIGQVLEGVILTPYLVGERIGLHPLAVIFSLFAFGELFGFTGVLVALPVSAVMLVALRELRKVYLNSLFYRGAPPPPACLAENCQNTQAASAVPIHFTSSPAHRQP